jgi:C4-dicarboxylate-specific signal transduction histidine kinase
MFSISDLARKLNVSTQSLYKKINKSMREELEPYIKTVGGQKYIDEQGAEIIKNSLQPLVTVDNESNQSKPTVVSENELNNENISENEQKKVGNELTTVVNENLIEMIDFYKKQYETIQDELKSEREQVKDLQNELKVEREHSRDITRNLAELTKTSQELTRESHLLLNKEQNKSGTFLLDERAAEVIVSEPSGTQENNKGGGFLRNLFKGKKKNS